MSGVLAATQSKAVELVHWKEPKQSAVVFGAGLFWFFLVGWLQYSSVTVLCYVGLFHLLARFIWRNGCRVLGDLNVLTPREPPTAPPAFVTEDEVLGYLTAATEVANRAFHAAYTLAVCDCTPLVFKWMGGLFGVALSSKLFGTTGLAFLAFVFAFTWPKAYSQKQKEIDAVGFLIWSKGVEGFDKLVAVLKEKSKDLPSIPLPSIPKASDLKKTETNVKPKSL